MIIDENTKLIGRFHKVVSPRGLNIYNPTFQELGINAIYMLFVNEDLEGIIKSMRTLNMAGAVAIGFENDPTLPPLLDGIDEISKYRGKVGYIKNEEGKLRGYSQGGEGLLKAIEEKTALNNKRISIVGSGNVVKALLFALSDREYKVAQINIYNRTEQNADVLKKDFPIVTDVHSLEELDGAGGDILINATEIGSKPDDVFYKESTISNFVTIADVTFEIKDTDLVKSSRKLGKNIVTGWDFFTYQGKVVLENILDQEIDTEVLRKHVYAGLSQTVK